MDNFGNLLLEVFSPTSSHPNPGMCRAQQLWRHYCWVTPTFTVFRRINKKIPVLWPPSKDQRAPPPLFLGPLKKNFMLIFSFIFLLTKTSESIWFYPGNCFAVPFQAARLHSIWSLRKPWWRWMESLRPSGTLQELGHTWSNSILYISREAAPNRHVEHGFVAMLFWHNAKTAFIQTWVIFIASLSLAWNMPFRVPHPTLPH